MQATHEHLRQKSLFTLGPSSLARAIQRRNPTWHRSITLPASALAQAVLPESVLVVVNMLSMGHLVSSVCEATPNIADAG